LPWCWRHSVRIDDTHKENEDEQEKVEDPSITVVSSVALIGGELPDLDFFWEEWHLLPLFFLDMIIPSFLGGKNAGPIAEEFGWRCCAQPAAACYWLVSCDTHSSAPGFCCSDSARRHPVS
jgi:hypothetical protein